MVERMWPERHRAAVIGSLLIALSLLATSAPAYAWGNGSSSSPEWPNFGLHDITCDIALRTATYTSPELLTWMTDWYIRNATDYGYSFDPSSTAPTASDNINAYTDDPDSHWQDWDNHTLYRNQPSTWDAATRVSQLYNMTRNHIYGWLMNGSVRYDADQHYAAYYAGLMAHYLMDITQFGHTDWTRLDHSRPLDDTQGATYHSYYEARSWSDRALRRVHVDLMSRQLPETQRVTDPAQLVRDLADFVAGRHGPDVQFVDVDTNTVTLGSTYVKMLEMFVTDYDAQNSYNGARGYSEELWNLTLDNLFAGMDNLTGLWTSAFLDARDMFRADAADLVVEQIVLDPAVGAYEGLEVDITAHVRNVGNASSGDFNVALFIDNESFSEARIALNAGQMMPVAFMWTAVAGEHEVRFVADVYQQVPEGNETNNVGWKMYSVEEAHHASTLTATPTTLTLLQDDGGTFNLTLTNMGNKEDTYRVYLDTYPGAIDFSMTLHVDEQLTLPPSGSIDFTIDVTTLLDNPVGPRYFQVVAEGGNSTSRVTLVVVIEERNVPPYIEVEYDFYGNVSVPMIFDASGTWDRNGDPITFEWMMDGISLGTGPKLVWAFEQEGVYVIELVADDGVNQRLETLEVSILDAIPPPTLINLIDWDIDAAQISWEAWSAPNASKYFSEYRFYVSKNNTDPDLILAEGEVAGSIRLVYLDNITVFMPFGYWNADEVHILVTTVNIYGFESPSNVITFEPEIRHGYRTLPQWDNGLNDDPLDLDISPLHFDWVHIFNITKYSFEIEWREWEPIGHGGRYTFDVYVGQGDSTQVRMDRIVDLSDTYRQVTGLDPGQWVSMFLNYRSSDGRHAWGIVRQFNTVENEFPRVQVAPRIEVGVDEEFTFHVVVDDPDGELTYLTIDWGDGTMPLGKPGENISLDKVYKSTGNYTITVEVLDNDDARTNMTTFVIVSAADSQPEGVFWDSVIAIALIIFIALLGVLVGHLSGYYRIGREAERKRKAEEPESEPEEEVEPEPEQTAEEIISELEEDLVDEEDREYFDHEPSVSELEEMIPRDSED
jgi:hypothetical protein